MTSITDPSRSAGARTAEEFTQRSFEMAIERISQVEAERDALRAEAEKLRAEVASEREQRKQLESVLQDAQKWANAALARQESAGGGDGIA